MTDVADGNFAGDRREHAATPALAVADRRQLWRWVWAAIRPFFGWLLAVLGAVALFLGWYGVSGQALTAKQLPYLVSGGFTGIALVILAAVVLATDDVRRELSRVAELERKINDLYALFAVDLAATADGPDPAPAPSATGSTLVALPGGTSFHRPDCALVAGKSGADGVNQADVQRRNLKPCRVCEPAVSG